MTHTISSFIKFLILAILLILVCVLGVCIGSVNISVAEIIQAIFKETKTSVNDIIICSVRIPRVLAAVFAGIGLSVSGVLLQITMSNALAAPNIIGVNSGAGLGVILIIVFWPGHFASIPLVAFLGALGAALLVYVISYKTNVSKVTVVLAGVAVTSLLNAIMNAVMLFYPNVTLDASSFMFGSLSGVRADRLFWPLIYISFIFLLVLLFSNALNVLLLGDTMAASLGLRVTFFRFFFLLCAATLAGSVVSFAGLLGFVGLIVPHIGRRFIGNDSKQLIPFTAMLGAIVVVLSDLIGRTLFTPFEIPVGIIMSFLGSPYFIYLLIKQKGSQMHA